MKPKTTQEGSLYFCGNITLDVGDSRPSPFYKVLVEAAELHARKNHNYAGIGGDPFRNFRECEDFGIPSWLGVLVRLSDKWSRIKNLASGIPDRVGEAIDETLMDQGVYSLIGVCLLREMYDGAEPDTQTENVHQAT